ncbi:MAG: hypothetical protein AB9869_11500 [Verrucomicrobiia bacterium]
MSVRVRMYRQGLGDCFLLTFLGQDASAIHMLIDCGVVQGTPDAEHRMQAVVRDIQATTDGHLDVLVATHEHWDHLSGFLQAEHVFRAIKVDQVWLAWTENPQDALAQAWRTRRRHLLNALRAASFRLGSTDSAAARRVRGFLEFFGEPLAAVGRSTEQALRFVTTQWPSATVSYLRPETQATLPGNVSARVYVLGPPRNELFVRRSRPRKKAGEVYTSDLGLDVELDVDFDLARGFLAAVERGSDKCVTQEQGHDEDYPIAARYRIPVSVARDMPFFRQHYGFPSTGHEDSLVWRRIDRDWLEYSERIGLKLDSDTNNTSLALAIELVDSGKVLLFPGDAQVGSWLSWQDLNWGKGSNQAGEFISTRALLERTVLYKVSHHGSHNGTLRDQGLEWMTCPDLVAMVPVDESMAHMKGWDMPFPPLLRRLLEKSEGRVIRGDWSIQSLRDLKPPPTAHQRWLSFLSHLKADPGDSLFVEYTIDG